MKVVFLDVDGVLNYKGCTSYYGGIYFVADEKLELLEKIIDATNAEIVLTSTWRQGASDMINGIQSFEANLYEELVNALEMHNLEIWDCTGAEEESRGEEIQSWISRQDVPLESFVILDDMCDEEFGGLKDWLLQTDAEEGLQPYHVNMAIQILNEN